MVSNMKYTFCIVVVLSLLLPYRPALAQNASLATALKVSYKAETDGDYAAAMKPLTALGGNGDMSYLVQLRLGWLNYCSTNHTESITRYGNAARLMPASLEPLLGMLNAQQAAGKTDDAFRTAQVILRYDSNNYTALSHSAWLLYLKQDYRQAATIYRKLAMQYPTDTEMLIGLGYSLKRNGDTSEATKCFHTILLLSPDNARAQAGLASEESNAKPLTPRTK